MPRYEHLRIVRLPDTLERRKRPGFGTRPDRDSAAHGTTISNQIDAVVTAHQRQPRVLGIDPSLILRVRMVGSLQEDEWAKLGLTVVSADEDRTLVLFASDEEMREFKVRVSAYLQGPRPGRLAPPYASFVANIEEVGQVSPRDRIGIRLREDGIVEASDFLDGRAYTLDVELWDLGRRELRERKLNEIAQYVVAQGGSVADRYIGPSLTIGRVIADGAVVRNLLTVTDVAFIDRPPEPDVESARVVDQDLMGVGEVVRANENSPLVGVIDTGSIDHPLLESALFGSIGSPAELGTVDANGHGTRVGGVAVYGDLRAGLVGGTLTQSNRICSAKVLTDEARFPDTKLVPSIMREAISGLNNQFGCRVFVISLGDRRGVYRGGKVSSWAAALDDIARELDVVLVVSAGNGSPPNGRLLDRAVIDYPNYLVHADNRLYEPATAMNVLTVGALAHAEGIPVDLGEYVAVRPITRKDEPSPFTRIGPGVSNSTKPDLCDYGGTLIADPAVARLRDGSEVPSAGMLTLYHLPVTRLLTSASGTSLAAPIVAFKAAQVISSFPGASANLVRALLATAAEVPVAAHSRLAPLGDDAIRNVCGYGVSDLERALYSDDPRVLLYAEDELPIDHFAVYEIPIPDLFQRERGQRDIRVTLAFDPPVRHSRSDYLGITMNYRLFRGCDPALLFEHCRKRTEEEGEAPEIEARFGCKLVPTPKNRDQGTLQSSNVTFARNIERYGDRYYLVVRCQGGWASDSVTRQKYAMVVQIEHRAEAPIQLYQRVRQRIRQRV